MVESFDLVTALQIWLNEVDGEVGDRHQIWQRIHQEIDTLRAEGLTPPGDLVRLEQALAAELLQPEEDGTALPK